ncbi:hypothetical protein ACKURH_26590 [Enterobacter soli]|jgi:hypothetical protein|uniref:hypothetical protein n=1 Tax=Enterobacter kobei TaxID=208224 RepID=UPI0032F70258|nr:hypothetical protein [Enterobacter soli]
MTDFRGESLRQEDERAAIQGMQGDWQFSRGNDQPLSRQSDDERQQRLELIRAAVEGRK